MKDYSIKTLSFIEVANPYTGEFEPHKLEKINEFKKVAKGGWQMIYVTDRDDVILQIKGTKRLEIFFWIERQFKNKQRIVVLNQEKIAKKLKTTRPFVGSVISKMVETDYLHKVDKNQYMLNPFFYIPYRAKALELQQEWIQLKNKDTPFDENRDKHKYQLYLASDEWREKAKEVMGRDNMSCVVCGSNESLEVHHKTYKNIYEEPQEDLTTLCRICHERVHAKQEQW